MGLGARLNGMMLTGRRPGSASSGGGGGSVLLNFAPKADQTPYDPTGDGWVEDDSAGSSANITSGRWRVPTTGFQSIHAPMAVLDLNGETKTFVEVKDLEVDGNTTDGFAMVIISNYTPGAWNVGTYATLDGYWVQIGGFGNEMRAFIRRINSGAQTFLTGGIFAGVDVDSGNFHDVRLEIDTTSGDAEIDLKVDNVSQLATTDSTGSKITSFRTVALCLEYSGSFPSGVSAIDAGPFA